MIGADAIVKCLEEEKVKYVFGYPGVAICPFYNSILDSSIETILHWAQDYCKDGELAFEENRGRATKENSPFKGRPRIRFVSENEKEEYLKQKEEYYKKD